MSHGILLVVDDDHELRETLAEVLREEGYRVHQASNGKEALQVLQRGLQPCLIVLDDMMPIMSGTEFLARLPEASAIPVLVITAFDRIKNVGEDISVLHKPFDVVTILEAVKRHC